MPDEPGNWEATWFHKGDPEFRAYRVGPASFGLNICSELWALETYAGYAADRVDLVLAPRATESATRAKWLAAGVGAAVRSGAFSLSSKHVDPSGAYGGSGWIIDPSGEVQAITTRAEPFVTRDIDLTKAEKAKESYPLRVAPAGGVAAAPSPFR